MSRYFSKKYSALTPYIPGEQPTQAQYIKLNTNENPYPPSERAINAAREQAKLLELYSDPNCTELSRELARVYDTQPDEILTTNGSDEILNFAFMAFCDKDTPAVFADITYGFYPVFADVNFLPTHIIPLNEDFTINPEDYYSAGGTVFIANPNAPTAIALTKDSIESIIRHNSDNIVVIDEAYVDFGAESCVPLIHKYENLLVTQTFSKSRSMAGARLGFGIACEELIKDLNTVKFSTNPYNINRMTMASGIAELEEPEYTKKNIEKIINTREYTMRELKKLGFEFTNSATNFLFARHPKVSGEEFYRYMKENGILIRHFDVERIKDYNRISIGMQEQMEKFISLTAAMEEIQ